MFNSIKIKQLLSSLLVNAISLADTLSTYNNKQQQQQQLRFEISKTTKNIPKFLQKQYKHYHDLSSDFLLFVHPNITTTQWENPTLIDPALEGKVKRVKRKGKSFEYAYFRVVGLHRNIINEIYNAHRDVFMDISENGIVR
eukprot:Pgem_evm1s14434